MRPLVRNDAFARCVRERYTEDYTGLCPVCGAYIYWPSEPVEFGENGRLCHTHCSEEGYDNESEDFQ